MRAIVKTAVLVGVVLAALLGIAGAIGRATAVLYNAGHDPADGTLTGYDRLAVEIAVGVARIDHSSERYREYESDVAEFSEKYYTHRLATFLHVLPAALLFLLAPFQFSAQLRSRYINVHRWSGRVILVTVIPVGLSGFFFGTMPFGGVPETSAILVFGGLFLFAAGRAFIAIRLGDVVRHREWMIRMFAVVIGISTMRVVDLVPNGRGAGGLLRNRQRDRQGHGRLVQCRPRPRRRDPHGLRPRCVGNRGWCRSHRPLVGAVPRVRIRGRGR